MCSTAPARGEALVERHCQHDGNMNLIVKDSLALILQLEEIPRQNPQVPATVKTLAVIGVFLPSHV